MAPDPHPVAVDHPDGRVRERREREDDQRRDHDLTPDGGVLAVPVSAEGERGPAAFIAATADLRANLRRLGMAAGLDDGEWAELARLAEARIGLALGGREGEEG